MTSIRIKNLDECGKTSAAKKDVPDLLKSSFNKLIIMNKTELT